MSEKKNNRFEKFKNTPNLNLNVSNEEDSGSGNGGSLFEELKINEPKNETTRQFQFSIKPSKRKKLTQIRKGLGKKSDSSFLSEIIDVLYDDFKSDPESLSKLRETFNE